MQNKIQKWTRWREWMNYLGEQLHVESRSKTTSLRPLVKALVPDLQPWIWPRLFTLIYILSDFKNILGLPYRKQTFLTHVIMKLQQLFSTHLDHRLDRVHDCLIYLGANSILIIHKQFERTPTIKQLIISAAIQSNLKLSASFVCAFDYCLCMFIN